MAASVLNIGVTGLNAAQAGILTTGHNISNASTPGFSRQQLVQQANEPLYTGSGFLGQGVNVETVKRVYSQYLNTQVLSAQTGTSEMDAYQAQINQIDNLVADPNAGLSPAMTSFFSSMQDLAADPTSIPSRQALLSASQALVARFQSVDERLSEIRAGTNSQITSEVSVINSYAQQLGDINQRIIIAQSNGASQSANDLLDQRDLLITNLNKEIRVSSVPQSDGTLSIFIGNGQPLVVATQAATLQAVPDSSDPLKVDISLKLPTGGTTPLPDSQFSGGTLGGLLSFRDQTLDPTQNALGRVAIGLAQSVNNQHKLGLDLTGALGGNFFNVPSPAVFADSGNPAPAVAMAVSISNVANLTTSDYQLTSTGGGNYTLVRLADNAVLVSNGALPASVDGMTITPAGTPGIGSSYIIQPTRAGARDLGLAITDPRNIAIAAPIRTSAALTNTGTGSIDLGAVSSVTATPPPAAITLRYLSAPVPSLDGFPVGSTVDVGSGQIYTITSPTMKVPYTIGNNISFNGIGVKITGAPVNGDSFQINPQPGTTPSVGNTGLASLFGVPAAPTTQGASIGTVAPAIPLAITTGSNDQFTIALNGGGVVTKTVAAGTYTTAASLASAIQTAIGAGATVSVDPSSGKLMVTSTTQGGATAVALGAAGGNLGYTALFGGGSTAGLRGLVSGTLVLPVAPSTTVDIKAGVNDRFNINVDGAGPQIAIIPAGSYTPANLASQMQTSLNALVAAPGVSVAWNGANLVVTSNQVGGASSIALSATAAGTGVMAATGSVTRTDSLPSAPVTIAYNKATNTLSGFPVGASVSVAGDPTSPHSITSTVDKVAYTSGAIISFNGVSFAISGSPTDGDTFSIAPNTNGVADNRNALLIGNLQSQKLLEGTATSAPAATFQSAYAEMVSQVGNKAREVKVTGDAQQSLTDQAQTARDSVSAVNLDEEAANLMKYQQAYQASAKLITVAGKLFDALLAM